MLGLPYRILLRRGLGLVHQLPPRHLRAGKRPRVHKLRRGLLLDFPRGGLLQHVHRLRGGHFLRKPRDVVLHELCPRKLLCRCRVLDVHKLCRGHVLPGAVHLGLHELSLGDKHRRLDVHVSGGDLLHLHLDIVHELPRGLHLGREGDSVRLVPRRQVLC